MRVFRKGDVAIPTLTEQDYEGIKNEDRAEYEKYFKDIWMLPILHNSRSTNVISDFWRRIMRLSFIASKSGLYDKHVVKTGDHQRQKFSVYVPKKKDSKPRRVVMFLHGGFYVNGAEEAFEYLASHYCQAGYILVTVGFRQLTKYNFHDSLWDVDRAFKKMIEMAPQFGGDNKDMCILTWSSSALMAYANLYQHLDFYSKHVSCMVNLGTALHSTEMNRKIELALFDQEHDITHIYPPFYYHMGPLPQKIKHVTGSKGHEFEGVYQSSEVEFPKMK